MPDAISILCAPAKERRMRIAATASIGPVFFSMKIPICSKISLVEM